MLIVLIDIVVCDERRLSLNESFVVFRPRQALVGARYPSFRIKVIQNMACVRVDVT